MGSSPWGCKESDTTERVNFVTVCLGWPYMAWLSFTELDKAVVHMVFSFPHVYVTFLSRTPTGALE